MYDEIPFAAQPDGVKAVPVQLTVNALGEVAGSGLTLEVGGVV